MHTSGTKRTIKLTKTEVRKLNEANTILKDLKPFTGVQTLEEALARIGEDGTVGEPVKAADKQESSEPTV